MPKMMMETEDKKVWMNVTANQCPGCPSNLATRLVMQVIFENLADQQPIIFGQGVASGGTSSNVAVWAPTTAPV